MAGVFRSGNTECFTGFGLILIKILPILGSFCRRLVYGLPSPPHLLRPGAQEGDVSLPPYLPPPFPCTTPYLICLICLPTYPATSSYLQTLSLNCCPQFCSVLQYQEQYTAKLGMHASPVLMCTAKMGMHMKKE